MTTTILSDAALSALAREAYAASLAATGDHGCADDAARVTLVEHLGGRTGTFDSSTLTWTSDPIRFIRTDHDGASETLALVILPKGKKLYSADLGRETPYGVLVEQGDHYAGLYDLDGDAVPSRFAAVHDCAAATGAPTDVIAQVEDGWATGLKTVERA